MNNAIFPFCRFYLHGNPPWQGASPSNWEPQRRTDCSCSIRGIEERWVTSYTRDLICLNLYWFKVKIGIWLNKTNIVNDPSICICTIKIFIPRCPDLVRTWFFLHHGISYFNNCSIGILSGHDILLAWCIDLQSLLNYQRNHNKMYLQLYVYNIRYFNQMNN